MHISHSKSFNIPVSFARAILAHMINMYEICLNITNYPIYSICKFQTLPVDLHFGLFGSDIDYALFHRTLLSQYHLGFNKLFITQGCMYYNILKGKNMIDMHII